MHPFFTFFALSLPFWARMAPFLYLFCSFPPFSGTNDTLSLPFLLFPSLFGHEWHPFFPFFALSLPFRARMAPFLYLFCSFPLFSGTNSTLSLPFLLLPSLFGHEWHPMFYEDCMNTSFYAFERNKV
jgi:hypothetical protein